MDVLNFISSELQPAKEKPLSFSGIFQRHDEQHYTITLTKSPSDANQTWTLIALEPEVDEQLKTCADQQQLNVWGHLNSSGSWLVVEKIGMA